MDEVRSPTAAQPETAVLASCSEDDILQIHTESRILSLLAVPTARAVLEGLCNLDFELQGSGAAVDLMWSFRHAVAATCLPAVTPYSASGSA